MDFGNRVGKREEGKVPIVLATEHTDGFVFINDPSANEIPQIRGVYWLIAMSKPVESFDKNDPFRHISRLTGVDKKGILYIGKTTDLKGRLYKKLVEPIKKYKPNSKWGDMPRDFMFDYFHSRNAEDNYPRNTLSVVFRNHLNPEALEEKLLYSYRQTYGELPPFNRNLPYSNILPPFFAKIPKDPTEISENELVGPLDSNWPPEDSHFEPNINFRDLPSPIGRTCDAP